MESPRRRRGFPPRIINKQSMRRRRPRPAQRRHLRRSSLSQRKQRATAAQRGRGALRAATRTIPAWPRRAMLNALSNNILHICPIQRRDNAVD
ncbi:hypothetical protein RPC_2117 [Rhodopseudomonas palustris BisB18]|uniref:Uncharacterized protein n=1 Tax=Rhodopseudomonas palustris (strain BisB18) TaxID=316056 RepID=Q216L5_RHOPB